MKTPYHGYALDSRDPNISCGAVEDYPRTLEDEGRFATEQACREYLMQLRWPQGFVCPRCGGRMSSAQPGACPVWAMRLSALR